MCWIRTREAEIESLLSHKGLSLTSYTIPTEDKKGERSYHNVNAISQTNILGLVNAGVEWTPIVDHQWETAMLLTFLMSLAFLANSLSGTPPLPFGVLFGAFE